MKKTVYYSIIILLISFGITSCGLITEKYEEVELTKTQQSNLYRDYQETDTNTIANIPWQEFYNDAQLQDLIQKGLSNNYDLQNAILSIDQMENLLKQSKLAFLPSLDFNPNVSHRITSKGSLNLPPNININLETTTISLGFETNWEIDIWGKLAAAKRSSQASLMKSIAFQNAIKTALISNIADSYYTLMALDEKLKIVEQTVKNREKNVETINVLLDAGTTNGADLAQSKANLATAKLLIPDIKQTVRELENALCVLLAIPLQEIPRGDFIASEFKIDLEAGLPLQLLSYRPDVMAAESNFRQAFELTNVAKASFYPSLRLSTGSAGISALTTNTLFNPSSIFLNLIGGITQPIFQRGKLKTNHRNAKLEQQEAWNNFQKTLLVAGQEVSDAIYNYDNAIQKLEIRQFQIDELNNAVTYRMDLLQFTSTTNYTDVLLAQQNLLNAKLLYINDRLEKFQSITALYRSLGGGWK